MLLITLAVLYLLISQVVYNDVPGQDMIMMGVVIDLVILLVYTWLVLSMLKQQARYIQTVIALVGVAVLFQVFSSPVIMQQTITEEGIELTAAATLYMLALLSWNLLVVAHIYKCALESSMANAILLSFALLFLSLSVSGLLVT